MAIIPIIFFALVFGLGGLFSSSSSEAYSSELSITPDSAAASPVTPGTASQVQLPAKLVKQMFGNREPLPTCQTWRCLDDSVDGNGGELVQRGRSREGDPVTSYFRVTGGTLVVYTDNHLDPLSGDPAWTYEVCPLPDDLHQGCSGS